MLILSALLFPASFLTNAYAQDLDLSREKKDKGPKIDSETLQLRGHVLSKKDARERESDDIRVVLELDDQPSSAKTKVLTNLGVKIGNKWNNLVEATIPAEQLDALAALEFVNYIRQPSFVVPALVSEGAEVIEADDINAAGFTGKGVKVGVIDTGFNLASPEIAGNIVETKSFRSDGSIGSDPDHGTAVSQIIVDVAPATELYLYSVDTDVSLLNALDYIIDQDAVDVVSMSLALYNVGPYDGTSEVSQAVDDVRNSGILFVTAAGNDARRHWEGNFVDSDGDGWRNFGGPDETIGITAQAGQVVHVYLSWNDWPTSMQDYDLYIMNNALGILAFSENPQFLGFTPNEHAAFVAPSSGTYHIGILKFDASADVSFDLFASVDLIEYNVESSSLNIPSDAVGALTVGASHWEGGALESFSSHGPTKDGRVKPDLTGPDAVTTTTISPFFGTSAGTPYVAGAAALVRDVYPGADPDVIQSLLEENTLNNHDKTNDEGTGMVNVSFLLAAIPTADAGGNQTVNENAVVSLDGSNSTDSDGIIVSYLWEQVGGEGVSLIDSDSATASFTAPQVIVDSQLFFKLSVEDNLGATDSQTIRVDVKNVNALPIANAGSNQTVSEGSPVALNGSASSDPDEDILSYSWSQIGGASVALVNSGNHTATFTAPSVDPAGAILTFQLAVEDSKGANATDTVIVNVININQLPVADAGTDQTIDEGTNPVTLDGSSSHDSDDDSLSFSWIQIAGPAVVLSNSTSPSPTFAAPEVDAGGATLTFELTVDDGISNSTDTVNINVTNTEQNQPPVAEAGADQTVNEGSLVTLDGAASFDADGDELLFSWIQTAGTIVVLSDSDSISPSFTAPSVELEGETLTFELQITDAGGLESSNSVNIIVENVNQSPTAEAGADFNVDEATSDVALDGAGSFDSDGSIATYLWEQTGGPSVSLNNDNTATATFDAPSVDTDTDLTFKLTVTDTEGETGEDSVIVTVNNVDQNPVADAGADQTVNEGDNVALDGTGSSDPDGNIQSYSWTQTAGTAATLNDPEIASPSFTAPNVGSSGDTLTFELIVTDNDGATASDTVDIVVENVNQQPTAELTATPETIEEGETSELDASGSSDPDTGDSLTYTFTILDGAPGTITGHTDSSDPTATYEAPSDVSSNETITIEVKVDDGMGGSDTDTVAITIVPLPVINSPPVADAGQNQTVQEGAIVTLDGSVSSDPDADALTYSWIQSSGPAISLSDPTISSPTFVAPSVNASGAIITLELTVQDENGADDAATVEITVTNVNISPTADAGADQSANEGTLVLLDGASSSDSDGDNLSFSWVQINGTLVQLSNAGVANPSFNAPEVNPAGDILEFMLTVNDGAGGTATDTATVRVGNVNKVPIASAGPDQTVEESATVTLNGGGSVDNDGSIISYSWLQESGPVISIGEPSSPSFTFLAPKVRGETTMTFRLAVTDNENSTSEDVINVTIKEKSVSRGSGGGGGRGGGSGGGGGGGVTNVVAPEESPVQPTSFFLVNPLAKIIVQSTSFSDLRGVNILQGLEGQQIQIGSTLQNQQEELQAVTYIVQISDENGVVIDIGVQQTSIDSGQSVTLGRSWQSESGTYSVKVFVWDSFGKTPAPLAIVTERTITIE